MPRPETVDRAMEEIGKSAAHRQYFFEKLNAPSWLGPLAERGVFQKPPAKQEVEGGVIFPGWPESQYLARMARLPEAQEQVLETALAIPATDNIRVHGDLLEVALGLPPAMSAQLVDRACTWVQSRFEGTVAYKIGDLIEHIAAGGEAQAALRLASAAFALEPPPTIEEDTEFAPLPEPRTYLRDWSYEHALKKSLPALTVSDGNRTISLVCELLDRAIILSRRQGNIERQDYTYIWHNAIENDEHPPRLLNTLIAAVRDTATNIISNDPATPANVLAELRRHEWPVFKRIEYHLLERFSATAMGEIAPQAVQLAAIEHGTHHEAARLLKTAFGQLPPNIQEDVLRLIDAGPNVEDINRTLEFFGQPVTAANVERYSNSWRAQRFALLADYVPAAWRERVGAVLAAAGETRKLDEVEDGGTWVGPTSPKSVKELEELGPARVVEFLRTWEAPRGHFVDTPEGLGRILGDVIACNPAGYVEQAAGFQDLDPTFVRFFFSGLETAVKEHRAFQWEPVLGLAQWVLAQPREIPGGKTGLMEADESWQWTRGAIANLLEDGLHQRAAEPGEPVTVPIPFAQRQRVWQIIEPLTRDPDPTPDGEAKYGGDNMDPPTLAINSVRGKAMNATIAYALWTRHHLDRQPDRPPMSFAAMPEVQGALDEHLDIAHDPSLAVRSTYGRYFPWLHFLDPAWTQAAIPRIFATDSPQHRAAAWDAYLMFCRPYDALLPLLEQEYLRSVDGLAGHATAKKGGFRPADRLADHLMSYYLRNALGLDAPLLQRFFAIGTDEVRGHAITFLGRSLESNPNTPDDVLARLRALWESRVGAARKAQDIRTFTEELSHFGWWFSSRRFTPAWSFEQAKSVLTLVKQIEPEFKVAETLEALAPEHPLDSVEVARLMVGDKKGWGLFANEKHFQSILATALASGNAAAKTAADNLIQFFVTTGQFSYRSLLG